MECSLGKTASWLYGANAGNGRDRTGYADQVTPEGMTYPQAPMGYGAEPYGYYGPGMEHVGMDAERYVLKSMWYKKEIRSIKSPRNTEWTGGHWGLQPSWKSRSYLSGRETFYSPYCCS
jgi:hypothetical protein